MKKAFLIPVLLFALPAYAQVGGVIDAENNSALEIDTTIVETVDLDTTTNVSASTTATTTETTATTTSATTTDLTSTSTLDISATSSTPTLPVITKDQPLVTDTISIIPGSISLKLTSKEPASVAARTRATGERPQSDGLFGLIYTGFEEFVFKVFGI